jgi:antitoxin VapB
MSRAARDEAAIARHRAEVEARLAIVRDIIARRGVAAAALSARRNFAWLTAGGESHIVLSSEGGVATLVVTARDVVAITQNIEAARLADEELVGLGIEVVPVPWWEAGAIDQEVARRTGTSVAVDADMESDLSAARSVLSALDQDRLVALGADAAAAVTGALDEVSAGMTELELASAVLARLPTARAPVLLVAADERIARYRHPLPKAVSIERRVMLVIVAERWGLHAAVTRFRDLEPPAAEIAAADEAVRQVERALHEATVPEATLGDVFAAGQAAYAAVGQPDAWREHHQGGTIAYQGRETVATPGDGTLIRAGMAFAWNPSLPGIKVEDTFILGPDGARAYVTGSPESTATEAG